MKEKEQVAFECDNQKDGYCKVLKHHIDSGVASNYHCSNCNDYFHTTVTYFKQKRIRDVVKAILLRDLDGKQPQIKKS